MNRAKNYELIVEHLKICCEPFIFEKEDYFTHHVSRKMTYCDMIDENKSLISLVKQFVSQNPKYI